LSTPIRLGGLAPQLATPQVATGGAARSAFSSLLQPSTARAATSTSGVSGRQVVAAALGNGLSPRSIASMAARAVGGPVGNAVAGVIDQTGQDAETLGFLDQVRNYILTNSIFEAGNMPLVESELGK
jgi:hypothetical protein